jgi:two-component system chemotaxis sensor kinase CheA
LKNDAAVTLNPELVGIFLEEAQDLLQRWEATCLLFVKGEGRDDQIEELFRTAHNLKGASKAVGLESFGAFVHIIEDCLSRERTRFNSTNVSSETKSQLGTLLLECHTVLESWTDTLRQSPDPHWMPETRDTEIQLKDWLEGGTQSKNPIAEPRDSQKAPAPSPNTPLPPAPTKNTDRANETIRISAFKLDQLLQLIGEMSIQQSIVWHGRQTGTLQAKASQTAIALSNKIIKEVQSQALSLRMQPVHGMFQRLERSIRDVARQLSKPVEIDLQGADVEFDRAVMETVTDPLIHIVRNAVDHGLESDPTDRVAAGKNPSGLVRVIAAQDATGVTITVQDDGRGLNREKILQKALEKRLITSVNEVSDDDVGMLIFEPGFSTAETVTEISGRGVGMDVVKRSVDSLGGEISIETTPGKGTSIRVWLPTHVNIIDALIVTVAKKRYAVPVPSLEEIINLLEFKLDSSAERGKLLSLRGKILPVEKLDFYLGLSALDNPPPPPKSEHRTSDGMPGLIIRAGRERVIFSVDQVLGQQQIVVRKLNESLKHIPGFIGGTILGDGEPGMVIDLPGIARTFLTETRGSKGSAA